MNHQIDSYWICFVSSGQPVFRASSGYWAAPSFSFLLPPSYPLSPIFLFFFFLPFPTSTFALFLIFLSFQFLKFRVADMHQRPHLANLLFSDIFQFLFVCLLLTIKDTRSLINILQLSLLSSPTVYSYKLYFILQDKNCFYIFNFACQYSAYSLTSSWLLSRGITTKR